MELPLDGSAYFLQAAAVLHEYSYACKSALRSGSWPVVRLKNPKIQLLVSGELRFHPLLYTLEACNADTSSF